MEEIPKINSSSITPTPDQLPHHKRKLRSSDLRTSSSFKIRALVRQLRPLFIQVLQTPDFRHCKAAHELQMQMKLLMDLYKQMNVKMESHTFSFKSSETQDRKTTEALQVKEEIGEYEHKETISYMKSKIKADDGQPRDSYIVGSSVFGWNFITFRGGAPVYYGMSKESFRISSASISSQRAESPK